MDPQGDSQKRTSNGRADANGNLYTTAISTMSFRSLNSSWRWHGSASLFKDGETEGTICLKAHCKPAADEDKAQVLLAGKLRL